MNLPYPILEFDDERRALIEPSEVIKHRDLPDRCVITFFREVIEQVSSELECEAVQPIKSAMGEIPVYAANYNGTDFSVLQGAVGAPLAAACLEEVIARGARQFVVCGEAGVIDSDIAPGNVIVPTSALRDEGTSYHYLSPGRIALPSQRVVQCLLETLARHNCPHVTGMTWTTDAFYRETPAKIESRRQEGCIVVEMEAAAYFAVAQFRGVELAQILCGGDDIGGSDWDPRSFGQKSPARGKLFWLSVEACVAL